MTAPPASLAIDALRRQGRDLLRAGRLADAENLYRRLLADHSDSAAGHLELGISLMLQQRLDEAEAAMRRGLSLEPGDARGPYHLGEVLTAQGRLDEALASYRSALAIAPGLAEARANIGSLYLQLGRPQEAEAELRQAIAASSGLVQARNNLGIALALQNRWEDAIAAFREVIAASPGFADAHNNLGIALASGGRFNDAIRAYRQTLVLKPDHAGACHNLGNALKELGRLAEAEASYRRAIGVAPGHAVAWQHLGMVLCEQNRIAEGFECFLRHAALTEGAPSRLPHKLQHDREREAYLAEIAAGGPESGGRIAGPAVNPANSAAIQKEWQKAQPQIVIIDDLLTAEALEGLRLFCWRAPIWRKAYEEGYLGAMPEHGFACPLLAQIAEELPARFPAIFKSHPLLQHWAFKYDSRMSGIKLHADFAAVNVNFWITPDDANRDPQSGGLVVWDKAAPLDWSFARYNRSPDQIREFLAREGATKQVIPYRANRAVIFDSDLFHETDRIDFKDGYRNRRINVTLLYGRRGAPA